MEVINCGRTRAGGTLSSKLVAERRVRIYIGEVLRVMLGVSWGWVGGLSTV